MDMLIPVFVKGDLKFRLSSRSFEYLHRNISTFGVTGLPWAPLNSQEHFGKPVEASVNLGTIEFETQAHLMREITLYAEHMGVKFQLDPKIRQKVFDLIEKNGFYPTEYIRKYPRIPSDQSIQTFPLRVLAFDEGESDKIWATPSQPLIFDVGDLSPNGILIHTENQNALAIHPGSRIQMIMEPRGWFPMQISLEGIVCRIVDDLDTKSGNLIRYLGVKFTRVDDVNRNAFLDLLKDILERIQRLRIKR